MVTQALLFVLAAGLVTNAQDTNHVVNLPHNQPHYVVIDGRQPFQPGPLPPHLPLPVQQTLIALSQADIPNILTASPAVSHLLLPANPTVLNPIITPVSAPIVLENPISAPVILENPVSAPVVLENANLFIPHTSVQTNSQIQTSSDSRFSSPVVSSASSAASFDTSNSAQVSQSPSEVSPISNIIGHSVSSVQPRTRTSPSGINEVAPLPRSQHLIANSQSQNSASGTADSAATLPLSSTSITARTSATATTAPSTLSTSPLLTTLLSNINVDASTVSSVDNEVDIATAELNDASSKVASATISSIDVTEQTSVSPATEASPFLLQTASIINKISSGDSSSPRKQQKLLPAAQFSARVGVSSDSVLPETQKSVHLEEIAATQSAISPADQEALSDGGDATQSLKDRVMPSAEEVTARRLATVARQRTSSSTFTPTSTSSIPTTTTTTTTTTATTPSPRTTGTTSTPVPSTSPINQIVKTATDPVPVTSATNPLDSIAKVFQSISRAAAQNVAKLAAQAQSQSQGLAVEPVVVGTSEGAEQSEAVGIAPEP